MPTNAQKAKPNGPKKANGGGKVNLRQATSSLKVYEPANANSGPVRSVPAAMGSVKATGRPRMTGNKNGDCNIVHREYLGDVNMAAVFSSIQYPINPGLGQSFPWLSGVAKRFESYRFRQLKFCFETSCSSTQTGTVLLVPDYDSLDGAPTSKVQALAYRASARAQPWLSFCQSSLREDLHKRSSYYVRGGSVPAGADSRLYDVGNMFLCVQGADANTVGELWVEYDVELMTPQFEDDALSAQITAFTNVTDVLIFGTAPGVTGQLQMTVSGNTITFLQAWEGFVMYTLSGTGLLANSLVLSGTSTRTLLPGLADAGGIAAYYPVYIKAQPRQTLIADASAATTVASTAVVLAEFNQA